VFKWCEQRRVFKGANSDECSSGARNSEMMCSMVNETANECSSGARQQSCSVSVGELQGARTAKYVFKGARTANECSSGARKRNECQVAQGK
jgi:hypothetical protein